MFLAGSMDYKTTNSWRDHVTSVLKDSYVILDPTHKNHDNLNEEDMKSHIQWELDALAMADNILLNFLPESSSPISLVELGLYVSSNKMIVVCPEEFYKSKYVYTLCETYNTPIYNTITEALAQF